MSVLKPFCSVVGWFHACLKPYTVINGKVYCVCVGGGGGGGIELVYCGSHSKPLIG